MHSPYFSGLWEVENGDKEVKIRISEVGDKAKERAPSPFRLRSPRLSSMKVNYGAGGQRKDASTDRLLFRGSWLRVILDS